MAALKEQRIDDSGLYLKATNGNSVLLAMVDVKALFTQSNNSSATTITALKNQIVSALGTDAISSGEIFITLDGTGTITDFRIKRV